ncbi:hypothetical protein [Streptomyces sp. NBC_00083]|uniref:hypothetical protein n=1 Tax=Streptomyces sp. NBC_00083 TaxID=2975647 RepID=UPI002B1D9E3B|nr:hypothetical protein [Streptomyces sp. NBC_00083]
MGRRYSIGGPWVLRAIGLDLPAGARVRIEGANGTGKPTLLFPATMPFTVTRPAPD